MDQNLRKISRYQNRKLYDHTESCYVTLEEIADIVKEGFNVVVTCKKTGEDITYYTLLNALVDAEKKAPNTDAELIRRVIVSFDGTFSSYIKEMEQEVGFFTQKNLPTESDRSPNQLN